MTAAVQSYLDICRVLIDASDIHMVECSFDLRPLNPPAEMRGTADFVSYSKKRRELHVVDFKYGKGVWVNVRDNAQLFYYSLGACLAINEPVSKVVMTVVQPRFGKGDPIRTATVDAVELAEWSFHLIDRARATQEPTAPTVAGDWCRFCAAKNSCLAHQNHQRTAKAEAAYHQFSLTDFRVAGT